MGSGSSKQPVKGVSYKKNDDSTEPTISVPTAHGTHYRQNGDSPKSSTHRENNHLDNNDVSRDSGNSGNSNAETARLNDENDTENDKNKPSDKTSSTHSTSRNNGQDSNSEFDESKQEPNPCNSDWSSGDDNIHDGQSKDDSTRNIDTGSIRRQSGAISTLDSCEENINDSSENRDNVTDTVDNHVEQTTKTRNNEDSNVGDIKKRAEMAKQDAETNAKERQASTGTPKAVDTAKKSTLNDNLEFYSGKIRSKPPPGSKIEEMHKWKGDYKKLERNHSYIQWLFPIPEGSGMNSSAQALQEHEAKAIRENQKLRGKVKKSFEMMLDFYGMKLTDENKGPFRRNGNWMDRYDHLNKSMHNWLRITRIIKSLGELGWENLQRPWVEFFISEAFEQRQLPKVANSLSMKYWIDAVKDETEWRKCSELYAALKEPSGEHDKDEDKQNTNGNKDTGGKDKQTVPTGGNGKKDTRPKSNNEDQTMYKPVKNAQEVLENI
ncbi:Opioid growth factor receptor-like protein 1 [Mactra antiquata]